MVTIPPDSNSIFTPNDIETLFTYPFAGVINNGDILSQENSITLHVKDNILSYKVISDTSIAYKQENFIC